MTNSDHKVNPYSPSAEYRYFLYDPDYGHTFYRTPEERDAAAESLIKGYLSDGEWIKDVVDVFAGEATHQVNEVERLDRVGTLDEDGYDENVEFFENADVDYKCDYQLQRLSLLTLAAPAPAEPTEMVVPPAEGELEELIAALKGDAACCESGQHDLSRLTADQLTRAADLLEQCHPTPVPVASNTYFEFVISDADDCTQVGGIAPTYAQALSEGQHYLAQYQQDHLHTLELRRVEVLHPDALPEQRQTAPAEPGRVERLPDGKPYPTPPVEEEAWSVAQSLRRRLAQNPMGCADPTLIRAAELLERLAGELATLRSAPHA